MTKKHIVTETITLSSTPLQDPKKIVTAFSKQMGLIQFVVSATRGSRRSLCEPFCKTEVVLYPKKGDLFSLYDSGSPDLHLLLREKLCFLQTASSMAKALLSSQLPEKPSPSLYALFSISLQNIPSFTCQNTLLICFYLKLLMHEGIYHPSYLNKKLFLDIANETKLSSLRNMSCSAQDLVEAKELFTVHVKDLLWQ